MVHVLEGRAFTLPELRRTLLAACGGFAVGMYPNWEDYDVWFILETIENVVELQQKE